MFLTFTHYEFYFSRDTTDENMVVDKDDIDTKSDRSM